MSLYWYIYITQFFNMCTVYTLNYLQHVTTHVLCYKHSEKLYQLVTRLKIEQGWKIYIQMMLHTVHIIFYTVYITLALAKIDFCKSLRTNIGNVLGRTSPCAAKCDEVTSAGSHILNSANQFCSVLIGIMQSTVRASVYRKNTSQKDTTYTIHKRCNK